MSAAPEKNIFIRRRTAGKVAAANFALIKKFNVLNILPQRSRIGKTVEAGRIITAFQVDVAGSVIADREILGMLLAVERSPGRKGVIGDQFRTEPVAQARQPCQVVAATVPAPSDLERRLKLNIDRSNQEVLVFGNDGAEVTGKIPAGVHDPFEEINRGKESTPVCHRFPDPFAVDP